MKNNSAPSPAWRFNIHVRRTQESIKTPLEAKTLFIYSLTAQTQTLHNFPPGTSTSFIHRASELFRNKRNVNKKKTETRTQSKQWPFICIQTTSCNLDRVVTMSGATRGPASSPASSHLPPANKLLHISWQQLQML